MSAHLDVAARGTRTSPHVPFRARLRSAGVWIAAAIVILITVIAMLLMTSDREASDPLHFDSTQRDGTKAMVETLRAHGVNVTTTEDKDTARAASAESDTTLLILTNFDALAPGDISGFDSTLKDHGNRLALVDPQYSITDYTDRVTVNDNLSPLSSPDSPTQPDCELPAAQAAGAVTTGESEYAETGKGTEGIHACYPLAGPGVSEIDGTEVAPGSARGQLLIDDGGRVPLTVIGNADWVTNEHIATEGNASLVLTELSRTVNLVVYYPQFDDQDQPPPSTLDYVPSWFIAGALWLVPCVVILLLILGRRFGPLAVERLPVIVPAVETVHGRAALSARSHDRDGALHTLRTAALLRIAKRLATGPDAHTPEIVRQIAAKTGRHPAEVDAVFVSATPTTDAELTELVHQLTQIESEIP